MICHNVDCPCLQFGRPCGIMLASTFKKTPAACSVFSICCISHKGVLDGQAAEPR